MNKVITVNLNGNAYQLEEGGYELLQAYLESAAAKLSGDPDREEIMSDIEQAIADKLRAILGAYKSVVAAKQAEAVIAEMGPVDPGADPDPAGVTAGGGATAGSSPRPSEAPSGGASSKSSAGTTRRLYRLSEGAMISGVCNGLAAFFNIDPTIVRLLFIVLTIVTGGGCILAYLVMAFVIPMACTDAEKNAARGATWTTQEFIRRAKAGYYGGMNTFPDEAARRQWKRKFKHDMRAWRHSFGSEMKMGAHAWQRNWQRYWASHPGAEAGWGIAMPFLSLFHAALTLGLLVLAVSLLATGAAFGVAPPAGVPVWLALILLIIVYGLVVGPLKMARRIFYYGGAWGHPGSRVFASVWDSLVWFAFAAVLFWLAINHFPAVQEALRAIPVAFRDAIHALRDWWSAR